MQELKLKPMTIEEYLDFTDTRPKDEKWELIEGEPVLSPLATDSHELIVMNLGVALVLARDKQGATWEPMPGIGTRVPVSPNSLPEPDLMVKEEEVIGSPISDDALVLFDILSPSNRKADREWRHRVYASVPNCQHYVTVSQARALVVRHDRANNWKAVEIKGMDGVLELSALSVSIPLRTIYRATPLLRKAP